ncbi:redoxin domain-containing protein [Candidatus Microgenomates bacterium]|nr:redoxin domain-containing protein [Candidatus Microgenomates bacterium]
MAKNIFIVITVNGIILTLIVFFINLTTKDKTATTNTQANSTVSTADHHGSGAAVDATIFNGLVGKTAPGFTLETYDSKKISLSQLKGKNVILFFNEGLMCYPSCWNQITAFSKDTTLNSKAVILNITVDPKNDWKAAVNKMPELALATVLFDSGREISQKYGVLTLPSSMHKGQFPGHSYVLIDKEGIVKFIKDDPAMAIRNQELTVEVDKLLY